MEDQQEALKFWTEHVAFEVRAKHPMGPDANWVEVAPPAAQSAMVIYPQQMMKNWAKVKPSILFECQDIQKLYGVMSERGVKLLEAPKQMNWGTYGHFVDPDGNEFLLKG